jgi:uncharacterized membrane protein YbhN (UPF0104 family)
MTEIVEAAGRRRSRWYVALALVVGAALLALALRRVDWHSVVTAVAGVSPGWLALGALALALSQLLLAVRWHVLVNAGAELSFADAFDFLMIGAVASLVLPSRLGDVARAVAAGRLKAISASRLLGTILVERLLDVLMLLGFGVGLSLLMPIPRIVAGALGTLFVAAVVAAGVLWAGDAGPLGAISRWLAGLRGPLSPSRQMFDRFTAGITAVREHGRVAPALVSALAVWTCSAVAVACNLTAFHVDAPWYAGAFVVIVVNLGGLIPAPPAGVGVYEYLTMVALGAWAVGSSTAFAFALVSHALSVAVVLALGSVSLVRQGLSLGALQRMASARVTESGS